MMLFRVPVGKMFYQGAPRLLSSDVSVEPCRPTGAARVAVEAYPAVVARRFLGNRSYKSDERKKQTSIQRSAREELVGALGSAALGVPPECDRDEGWILDPQLLVRSG